MSRWWDGKTRLVVAERTIPVANGRDGRFRILKLSCGCERQALLGTHERVGQEATCTNSDCPGEKS